MKPGRSWQTPGPQQGHGPQPFQIDAGVGVGRVEALVAQKIGDLFDGRPSACSTCSILRLTKNGKQISSSSP